jgi:SAM-dependent methyltransferase
VAWERTLDDPEAAGAITAAMDARGRLLGPALAAALDLSGHHHVLDVAGGSGVYAAALVRRWPQLRATLLERPPVDRAARVLLRRAEMADRVRVTAGDMLTEPLPVGADVHLFSHVLHDWGEDDVRRLLASSHAALASGGLFIDHDAHLDEDEAGPLDVAEYSVLLAHSTQGRCYSVGEVGRWLRQAGFDHVRVVPVAGNRTAVLARRP